MTQTPPPIQSVADLKGLKIWALGARNKMPVMPNGVAAESDNPETWSTFSEVWRAYKANTSRYIGIGFMFSPELGLGGVDLDKCVDEQGNISEYAQHIVTSLNSYTEYSCSGSGLHILTRGNLPRSIGADPQSYARIEMYKNDKGRFLITTGKRLEGTLETINDRQEQLLAIYAEALAIRQQEREAKRSAARTTTTERARLETSQGNTPYGQKALQEECDELASMPEGGRNSRLNIAAFKIGQLVAGGQLEEFTAVRELSAAATECGLDEREIEKTLNGGLEAGKREPRKPEPQTKAIDELIYGKTGEKEKAKKGCIDPEFILECLAQGEYGDSLLFAHLFRGLVLFDHTASEWYVWGGHYWEPDETGKIKHLISGKLASEYLKAGATLNLQASQQVAKAELSDNEEEKEQAKERVSKMKSLVKQLNERAFSLRQVSRCRNIQYFACSHKGMGITGEKWDRNTWLLGVPNGVIDLRLGECRPGNPEDYIRTVSPTEWKGLDCPAPRWERFLQEIFEDRAVEEKKILLQFLQRLLGYGITGEVREHVFAVLYGEDGRNGKDTLQLAMTKTLGSASGAIQKDVLLETGKGHSAGAPTPHLSDLQGRRLAWASEPEKGARFNVGQIKELSGGGDIPTRGLHEKKITKLKPSHLLLLLTNHKPHAAADDSAFWNRLIMITFNMRFIDNPIEPNEKQKDTSLWVTLEEETSGILAWLVRGCLSWQQQGLDIPASVKADGQKYREEEDQLLLFFQECCVIKPECTTPASKLYTAYETWVGKGSRMMNSTAFGRALGKKKFQKKTTMKGIVYQGIGLIAPDPYEDPMNSSTNPSYAYKDASQATLESTEREGNEQYEGFSGVFPRNTLHESHFLKKPGNTIHTIHSASEEETINPLVEPYEEGMNSSNKPFIGIHGETSKASEEADRAGILPTSPTPACYSTAYLNQLIKDLDGYLKTLPREDVMWVGPDTGIRNGYVSKQKYVEQIKECWRSGDEKRVKAAVNAILKKLGREGEIA